MPTMKERRATHRNIKKAAVTRSRKTPRNPIKKTRTQLSRLRSVKTKYYSSKAAAVTFMTRGTTSS